MEPLTVICRPARPEDTADVMELTRTIWDGEDYVPHVWAEWLADPAGRLAVAVWQGRVVGLGKLTRLGPEDWWLEGLRVDPQYEGRKVASQLHHHLLDVWRTIGAGTLRLATASFRLPVHHLCVATGFTRLGEYSTFSAPTLDEPLQLVRPLQIHETQAALQTIRDSASLPLLNGLLDLGWQWCTPRLEFITQAAEQGLAYGWDNPAGGLAGVLLFTDDPEDGRPRLCMLAGDLDEIPAALLDFRRLLSIPRLPLVTGAPAPVQVVWVAPLVPELLEAVAQAGFERTWEHSAYVYAIGQK